MKRFASSSLVLVAVATPAFATITAWFGDVVKIAPPANVTLNQLQSDVVIFGFDERQCVPVPAAGLATDQGMIPPNTLVSCHFFHADPINSLLLQGRARFDADILGAISTTANLDASDGFCGAGTVYPTGAEVNRGFETVQLDDYQLVNPRTIQMRMEVPANSFSDQLRVITECCPDGQNCD